jgi:hypothetical protein
MENTPMIRRLLIPLLGSGLLLAASATSVFAKCEGPNPPEFCKDVVVSLNYGGPGSLHAGTLQTLAIDVSKGEQPFDAESVTLTFARVADGSAVRVAATAAPVTGIWTADVNLPNGGTWTVVAEVVGADGSESTVSVDTIEVFRPPALPPSTTPVTPPVSPGPPILPIALVIASVVAIAGISGQVIREGSRRRTADAPAAVRSAATADRA